MAVNVIDTLKPKNNGDFPVVEAEDVAVGSARLDVVLEQKADKSALDATNAAVAGKANASDVATATANLQGQINQIEISATAEAVVAPEVAAARVGDDGTEYTTLKERLDAEYANTNSSIGIVKDNIKGAWKELNLLNIPDKIFKNTKLNTTTGAKTSGTETLYMIPVSAGTSLYFTQTNISIMQIGFYTDADGDNFISFAYNEGLTAWNSSVTVPNSATYVGVAVGTSYADTARVTLTVDNALWSEGYTKELNDAVYIPELVDTIEDVADISNKIDELGLQTLNIIGNAVNVYADTGINSSTGQKNTGQTGSTLYVIPVTSGNVLYITQCCVSIMQVAFYTDSEANNFVEFAYNIGLTGWDKEFTVPNGVSYIGVVVQSDYAATAYLGTSTNYEAWENGYRQQLSDSLLIPELISTENSVTAINGKINELGLQSLNYLANAVNVYENTSISSTTGGKISNQAGKTLYVIPVNAGDVYFITQCSIAIMLVGYYTDSEATNFVDFAYNQGLTRWSSEFTIPNGVSYIGIVVAEAYASTAYFGSKNNYEPWTNGYTQEISNTLYIEKLVDISEELEDLGITETQITSYPHQNAINSGTLADMTNINYYYSDPVRIGKGYKVIGNSWTDNSSVAVVVECQSDGTRLRTIVAGNNQADTPFSFTTSQDSYYIFSYNKNHEHEAKYIIDISQESEWITIGTGTLYPTITEGFAYAVEHNKKVIIVPGVYDLVEEGIASTSNGLTLPKEVWAYGVVFKCDLPAENWSISPVNVDRAGNGTQVYGLEIECSNCRYCIHDEMGYATGGYYHNIFKDLKLTHKSEASATLILPQCIGGGLGNGGYIEVVNCVCDCKVDRDISYHSYAHVTDEHYDDQTVPCTVIVKDSYLSGRVGAASIGDYETVMNKVYVSNCSLGTALVRGAETNIKIIDWNNVVRA